MLVCIILKIFNKWWGTNIFYFKDREDRIVFEYHETLPTERYLSIKGKSIINLEAWALYGLYRDAVYNSYKQKADLAQDIRERDGEICPNDPLYDYAICSCANAISAWKDSANNIKCYIAYNTVDDKKEKVGFVHFNENVIDDRLVIYIAQAGVRIMGQGIGRRLMQCVLSHYPAGREFYILTRVFNTEARILYQNRLHFEPIGINEIKQLHYDERYWGGKHTTTKTEIDVIVNNKVELANAVPILDM
ncbi:MAG: hypothetical protein AMJ43_02185 [Coxiella sp. DG_40]|nr:MAG: hypothetical protein AMJ43_02185 [Coxiella sp. DG_40]